MLKIKNLEISLVDSVEVKWKPDQILGFLDKIDSFEF